MALNTVQINGTITAYRQDGNHAISPVNGLVGVAAIIQDADNGAIQTLPALPPGLTDEEFLKARKHYIYVGGWDENNADESTPYEHKAGDLLVYVHSDARIDCGVYDGTYTLMVDTPPKNGAKGSHSKLLVSFLSGATTAPASPV